MRLRLIVLLGLAAALLAAPQGARAQSETKIGIGFGIGFLPMFIADDMKLVEKHAKAAGIESVVFDRSGAPYHGKVKTFADAAREGGLKF